MPNDICLDKVSDEVAEDISAQELQRLRDLGLETVGPEGDSHD